MRQLSTIALIWHLLRALLRHGNRPVYYHCPPPCYKDAPFEVERLELRRTRWGEDKLTIV